MPPLTAVIWLFPSSTGEHGRLHVQYNTLAGLERISLVAYREAVPQRKPNYHFVKNHLILASTLHLRRWSSGVSNAVECRGLPKSLVYWLRSDSAGEGHSYRGTKHGASSQIWETGGIYNPKSEPYLSPSLSPPQLKIRNPQPSLSSSSA